MVDVKHAVSAAFTYFNDLYRGGNNNLALEEVELSTDEKYWLVTLGFNPPATGFSAVAGAGITRVYKLFRVDAVTGEVLSMKIRQL